MRDAVASPFARLTYMCNSHLFASANPKENETTTYIQILDLKSNRHVACKVSLRVGGAYKFTNTLNSRTTACTT